MNDEKLTVIIPFLNEGEEVRNTLQSIRSWGGGNIPVIIIDDASEDGYDYESTAHEFNARYIRNSQRKGVAASRNLGVNESQTPYILLLDAHMRFYQENWSERIIEELTKREKRFICCQTKALFKQNGQVVVNAKATYPYGAFIDLVHDDYRILAVNWIKEEKSPGQNVEEIPCVLGAAYACSKQYWLYLRGLEGLCNYGGDEQYISMKVWLSGGQCLLLKDVIAGHIYRTQAPYKMEGKDSLYNKLFMAQTIMPYEDWKRIFITIQKWNSKAFKDVYSRLLTNEQHIKQLRRYYRKIFVNNMDYIKELNNIQQPDDRQIGQDREILDGIIRKFLLDYHQLNNNGLLSGLMGGVILLFHYARISGQSFFEDLAGDLLERIYKGYRRDTPLNFGYGLAGIGWGLEYLLQNEFVEEQEDNVLEEVDRRMMEYNPQRMSDWSLTFGIGGILCYVMARLRSYVSHHLPVPFEEGYLLMLKQATENMLAASSTIKCTSVGLDFLHYMETGELDTSPLKLTDLVELPEWQTRNLKDFWSLETGQIGMALNRMMNWP